MFEFVLIKNLAGKIKSLAKGTKFQKKRSVKIRHISSWSSVLLLY